MVSALLVDTLHNPSIQLQELFKTHAQSEDFPDIVASHFSNVFASATAFDNVLYLLVNA